MADGHRTGEWLKFVYQILSPSMVNLSYNEGGLEEVFSKSQIVPIRRVALARYQMRLLPKTTISAI